MSVETNLTVLKRLTKTGVNKVELLKQYAISLVGTPYRWGGDDPLAGFDCSGLVIELLQSKGLLPHGYDNTAQGLYNHFTKEGMSLGSFPGLGSLVFYGKSTEKITHIGFMLDNYRMLEAGGGRSTTTTVEDAIRHNAFVRIRPINFRADLVAIVSPKY